MVLVSLIFFSVPVRSAAAAGAARLKVVTARITQRIMSLSFVRVLESSTNGLCSFSTGDRRGATTKGQPSETSVNVSTRGEDACDAGVDRAPALPRRSARERGTAWR